MSIFDQTIRNEIAVCVLLYLQYTRTSILTNIIALYAVSVDASCTMQTTSGGIHRTTMFAGLLFTIIRVRNKNEIRRN